MADTILLIIEDDALMSRLYQKIFKFEGYNVQTASDGLDGLEKIRKEKPTIILLDIMMPRMNGLQVLEKLKADPDTKNIPVVVLTNLAGEKDAEVALSKGAIKYIIKSEYEPKQIAAMVKEILQASTRDSVPEVSN